MKLTKEDYEFVDNELSLNKLRLTMLRVRLQAGEPISKLFDKTFMGRIGDMRDLGEWIDLPNNQYKYIQNEMYYQLVYYQSVKRLESISFCCDRLKYYLDCRDFIRPVDTDNDR